MLTLKERMAERIRGVAHNDEAGKASSRWDPVKEYLFFAVNGNGTTGERDKVRQQKYRELNLATFSYEDLSDEQLLSLFELTLRRYYAQM